MNLMNKGLEKGRNHNRGMSTDPNDLSTPQEGNEEMKQEGFDNDRPESSMSKSAANKKRRNKRKKNAPTTA